jgi:intracellular sulfur oxidation DsrE/DsrF family protein
MKDHEMISEEQLNAFTDGELDAEEESRVFELSETCPELDGRLCRQRKLKELVQHAYREIPQPRRLPGGRTPSGRLLGAAVAALLLLCGGFAIGWFASVTTGARSDLTQVSAVQSQQEPLLIHITSSDPQRMEQALRHARKLLDESTREGEAHQVEIVANEGGLDLLRSDVSPFAAEISALAEQDVLFFACTRAIERLQNQGVEVDLLPEANDQYTALDRVVTRMQQGWHYLRI